MVLLDLENEFTDVLPGLSLPARAASFVFARITWIQGGEKEVFDMEAPPPWNFFDLCTLAFLVSNRETSSAKLMLSNLLLPCPPSSLLPPPRTNAERLAPSSYLRKEMDRTEAEQ